MHGVLPGPLLWSSFASYFAERGWEAHALNLRGHFTSDVADLEGTRMRITPMTSHRGRTWDAPGADGWGMGALAALLYRSPVLCWAWCFWRPPRRPRRSPDAADHELNPSRTCTTPRGWGWLAPLDELRAWMPDMTDEELSKMQELRPGPVSRAAARSGCWA